MPRLLQNESDRLSQRITFNMSVSDHERLVAIAQKQHVPFGQILRQLVRTYLKQVSK